MKTYKRLFLLFCCTVVLISNLFMCYKTPVFAKPTLDEDGHLHVYNWDDIKDSAVDWVMYMASMAGAIFADHDFAKYVQNKDSWVDYWTEDNVTIGENGTSVTFSQDLMAFIKQCIDEYAKTEQTKEENGGFLLLPTTNFNDVSVSYFYNGNVYRTFKNIVAEKGMLNVRILSSGKIMFTDPFSDPDHPKLLVANATGLKNYINNPEMFLACDLYCFNDWTIESSKIMMFPTDSNEYESCSEAEHYTNFNKGYAYNTRVNDKEGDLGNFCLYSTTGERVRVFVSAYAAQNYSVGNRKIYFTENYYNYVPEDLTVAVDDLQKSVDDLQKIIDELLKQIGNDTSEKEIEELLRLILEELRKNPGTGSGEGSGSGNVTVDIDLSTTNNWLSKIYTRLGDILDKMQEGIQTRLDEISDTLKKIKGWTIADTVVDAADAVADWLDFIKDMFSDVDSGVSAISSTMGDAANLMKTKFPFCIPWDVYYLLNFLAEEPQTPVFRLPIKLESYGIEEYIEVDMSRFSALSTLSRTILTVIYCYALLNLTMKIFPLAKEET